jgi:hypothetical protein
VSLERKEKENFGNKGRSKWKERKKNMAEENFGEFVFVS